MSLLYKRKFKRRKEMEREQYSDSWDGSIDDQEKVLEDHVSKYGWEF